MTDEKPNDPIPDEDEGSEPTPPDEGEGVIEEPEAPAEEPAQT